MPNVFGFKENKSKAQVLDKATYDPAGRAGQVALFSQIIPVEINDNITASPIVSTTYIMKADSKTITLSSNVSAGLKITVVAVYATTVTYLSINGNMSDSVLAGDVVSYVFNGTYWLVDNTDSKPILIDSTQTVNPTKKMAYIVTDSDIVLTIGDGTYSTCEVSVYVLYDCQVSYTGEGGITVTDDLVAGDYITYVWLTDHWKYKSVPVTGIDDDGQPFAFNIESLTHPGGVINITGKDANGNPFDYGLGRLVTNADEDNLVTGVEVKTSKTLNGKPIYKKYINGTQTIYSDNGSKRAFYISAISDVSIFIKGNGQLTLNGGTFTGRTFGIPSIIVVNAMTTPVMYSYCEKSLANVVTLGIDTLLSIGTTSVTYSITFEYTKTTD